MTAWGPALILARRASRLEVWQQPEFGELRQARLPREPAELGFIAERQCRQEDWIAGFTPAGDPTYLLARPEKTASGRAVLRTYGAVRTRDP